MSQSPDPASIYITLRRQHPAWQLLAARRAPLVLMCLKTLFQHNGLNDAEQVLYCYLLTQKKGRLEQEFIGRDEVPHVITQWVGSG